MEDYYAPEVKRLQRTLDIVLKGYESAANHGDAVNHASEIQKEIDAKIERYRAIIEPTKNQAAAHEEEINAMNLLRIAAGSGAVMPLKEFKSTMRNVNLVKDGDFKSELSHVWLRSLKLALDEFYDDNEYASDMPKSYVVVGRDVLMSMRAKLSNLWLEQEAHYERRWREVEPVFVTQHIQELSLVTGVGEK